MISDLLVCGCGCGDCEPGLTPLDISSQLLQLSVVGAPHLDVDGVGVGSSRQEQIKTHRVVSGDVGAET